MSPLQSILLFIFSLLSPDPHIEVVNAGIGGNTSTDLLKRVYEDVVQEKPDLAIVMVGTNDMVNSKKMIPYDTYKDNLSKIIAILKGNKIEVMLMSPLPVDTAYLFERHPRALFKEQPNEKLDSVRNIVARLSIENKLHFVDLRRAFVSRGVPQHNVDKFIMNASNSGRRDGVHPTPKGYELIGKLVYDQLVAEKLIRPGLKIICFGDSITKGVHVNGSGTSTGETYPAVLRRLLEQWVQ